MHWSDSSYCGYCGATSNTSHTLHCPNYGLYDEFDNPLKARPKMLDWRGVEITEGATIVYATRRSSNMRMVEAVVDKVNDNSITATVIHRQGASARTKVTLSNRYVTVVSVPESTKQTAAQEIAIREQRRQEKLRQQAECEHWWVHRNTYWNVYKKCLKCDKFVYGE